MAPISTETSFPALRLQSQSCVRGLLGQHSQGQGLASINVLPKIPACSLCCLVSIHLQFPISASLFPQCHDSIQYSFPSLYSYHASSGCRRVRANSCVSSPALFSEHLYGTTKATRIPTPQC